MCKICMKHTTIYDLTYTCNLYIYIYIYIYIYKYIYICVYGYIYTIVYREILLSIDNIYISYNQYNYRYLL